MRKVIIAIMIISALLSVGCGQYTARKLGGTSTQTLNTNEKLVNVTWKNDSLWIVTRPMRQGEIAETYEFKESSVFAVFEGTVIIKEVKSEG